MDNQITVELTDDLEEQYKILKYIINGFQEELCRLYHVEGEIDVSEVITICNQLALHTKILKDKMLPYAPSTFDANAIVESIDVKNIELCDDEYDDEYVDLARENPIEITRPPVDYERYR